MRMKVEAALKQQNFRFVRFCVRNLYRIESIKKDDKIRENIESYRHLNVEWNEQIRLVQNVIQDLQNHYDNLCQKEKGLEKKFKSEFPGLGKAAFESLVNQYKKRPRTSLKNTIANDFLDLGSAAVTLTKPVHLPPEYLEYLKGLDVLDIRPASIPQSVTTVLWELFTRLRRNKIDIEMRIRAQDLEIQEATSTLSNYEQKVVKCKAEIEATKQELNSLKLETVEHDRNIEIQLVLKMGQVEIKSRLTRNDTKNAVLIPRSEIETVNAKILEVGSLKINVMKKALNFRKGIALKEWEHKCLRMNIEDLKEELYYIQRIQVTRHIQSYLKRKAQGFKDDKTPQALERQIEAMKKANEKVLRDYVLKLEDVEKKIQVMKKKNELLDKTIIEMNVVRCEMELKRDIDAEMKDRKYQEKKMAMIVKRSTLVRKLQESYVELLALQTEHELLRLKRFPVMPLFQTLDDDLDKKKTS